MDSKAVASSIEAKYKDLKDYLDKAGDPAGLSLGQRFLDKIIQIDFRIPTLSLGMMKKFMSSMMTFEAEYRDERKNDSETNYGDHLAKDKLDSISKEADSFDEDPKVRSAIESVQIYLKYNPRREKRFLNSFRLLTLIATYRGLIEQEVISLELLARWVIIQMRWPDIIDTLAHIPHFTPSHNIFCTRHPIIRE
jgi:hypothetical protein